MPLIWKLPDELIAFETGAIVAQGPPRRVLADPVVIDAYLGADRAAIFRSGRTRRPARKKKAPAPRR